MIFLGDLLCNGPVCICACDVCACKFCACLCVHVHMCVYACTCMHVHAHVHAYVYESETQREDATKENFCLLHHQDLRDSTKVLELEITIKFRLSICMRKKKVTQNNSTQIAHKREMVSESLHNQSQTSCYHIALSHLSDEDMTFKNKQKSVCSHFTS